MIGYITLQLSARPNDSTHTQLQHKIRLHILQCSMFSMFLPRLGHALVAPTSNGTDAATSRALVATTANTLSVNCISSISLGRGTHHLNGITPICRRRTRFMWCKAFWTAEPHQVTLTQLTSFAQVTQSTNLSRPESNSVNAQQAETRSSYFMLCSTLTSLASYQYQA
jgi:hypothetical protein